MKKVLLSTMVASSLFSTLHAIETASTTEETLTANKSKTVSLATGWNMVSIAGYESVDVSKVLGNSTYVSVVYYFDATKGKYVSYVPSQANNEYTTIQPTDGVWVNAIKPFSMTFNASISAASSATTTTTSTTDTTSTTKTRIAKPVVGDCATVAKPYGDQAVAILAKYGYTKCAVAGSVLIVNSHTDLVRGQDITAITQSQADIVAELLDNNQDGYVDDEAVYNKLKTGPNGTWMNIQSAANETNEATIIEELLPYFGKDMGVKNAWLKADDYTAPHYEKTMLLEEGIHLWHMYGYAKAYPSVWGVSADGCTGEESTKGCNWNQSTLTKLTLEAMNSSANWYRHGENTSNNSGTDVTGTCTNPGCASIEFVKDLLVVYTGARKADAIPTSTGTTFPASKDAINTILNSTTNGKAFKAILDDPKYNQLQNGFKYSYNPASN